MYELEEHLSQKRWFHSCGLAAALLRTATLDRSAKGRPWGRPRSLTKSYPAPCRLMQVTTRVGVAIHRSRTMTRQTDSSTTSTRSRVRCTRPWKSWTGWSGGSRTRSSPPRDRPANPGAMAARSRGASGVERPGLATDPRSCGRRAGRDRGSRRPDRGLRRGEGREHLPHPSLAIHRRCESCHRGARASPASRDTEHWRMAGITPDRRLCGADLADPAAGAGCQLPGSDGRRGDRNGVAIHRRAAAPAETR